ncbi:MAG: hypothetical protein RLY71_1911 [Pseudomonadota bacterium]|jgi:methylglutaconyl-CoA hydratase
MTLTTLDLQRRPLRADQADTTALITPCVAWLWMNKPDVHNAFDETLIAELTATLQALDDDASVRVVVLAGRGKSFSAGADLNWMQRQSAASPDENLADARRLAELFRTLSMLAKPTIARVHGAALGGGMGLAAATDICVASDRAVFATSEVRFGIIPAAISPYVIRAIGERQAYRYFQTAERISAARARELGLAHEVTDADGLDAQVQQLIDALLAGGPCAQAAATDLIRAVANRPVDAAVIDDTARRIATLRATPEAREGLSAFLQKRPPAWMGA